MMMPKPKAINCGSKALRPNSDQEEHQALKRVRVRVLHGNAENEKVSHNAKNEGILKGSVVKKLASDQVW